MKKIKFLAILIVLIISTTAYSQVSQDPKSSEEANTRASIISKLPLSPKTKAPFRYFYFPNLQAYFDNLYNLYYYKVQGQWVANEELPPVYGGYSIFNNRRVVVEEYIDDKPYEMLAVHKLQFPYNSKGRFSKEGI